MSRVSSRGKDRDRTRLNPVLLASITSPEIVPGKFTENDWLNMLEKDNAQDFILDFVDDIVAHTLKTIYKRYLLRKWNFEARDEGEMDIDEAGWVQDDEPDVLITDCWAQGSVPKIEMHSIYTEDMLESGEIPERKPVVYVKENNGPGSEVVKRKKAGSEAEIQKKRRVTSVPQKVATANKRKMILKSHGRTEPADVVCTTESSEKTQKSLKTLKNICQPPRIPKVSLTSRKSFSKNKDQGEVVDDMGNFVSFSKLEPDTLPHHEVHIRYSLGDQRVETFQKGIETMRAGQGKKRPIRRSDLGPATMSEAVAFGKTKSRRFIPIPGPPSILENINVVQGVTIIEAGHARRMARQVVRQPKALALHLRDMRPIRGQKDHSRSISVTDLLECSSPILRLLDESKPLPPILSKSEKRDSSVSDKLLELNGFKNGLGDNNDGESISSILTRSSTDVQCDSYVLEQLSKLFGF